eukprot:CAMPEP_0179321420 /NCGR_PEP_ID=MMETSP0797-20121207/58605_1 /TAXON_ID=47934 /ORGANISM="Dinophysis acuminata, Strain DAEP01" /LENGTH=136 /DNA_ID=CAMNT_0021033049 /DNA_START=99 /DNA_END=507 /DNA_ORIENTATION=-
MPSGALALLKPRVAALAQLLERRVPHGARAVRVVDLPAPREQLADQDAEWRHGPRDLKVFRPPRQGLAGHEAGPGTVAPELRRPHLAHRAVVEDLHHDAADRRIRDLHTRLRELRVVLQGALPVPGPLVAHADGAA